MYRKARRGKRRYIRMLLLVMQTDSVADCPANLESRVNNVECSFSRSEDFHFKLLHLRKDTFFSC
jgi:hypothetical protein